MIYEYYEHTVLTVTRLGELVESQHNFIESVMIEERPATNTAVITIRLYWYYRLLFKKRFIKRTLPKIQDAVERAKPFFINVEFKIK